MSTPLVTLVEQTVLERLRAKTPFTALDISNALKSERYPVQHTAVAAIVRDIFQSGAMQFYDYDRRLIPVVTEGGEKQTQAFLYLADESKEREYTQRDQSSLPPVPSDRARDLADSVPAISPLASQRRPRQSHPVCSQFPARRTPGQRRDGALSIARRFIRQMGWQDGQSLGIVTKEDRIILTQTVSDDTLSVRVWTGNRLRICRSKLSLLGLSIQHVTIAQDGDSLSLHDGQ